MKETITIKNFGGLKDVTIPLNSINIFIGKQASGKSVTAKLIYFFKRVFEDVFDGLGEGKNRKEIEEEITKRFKKYFPSESWSKEKFSIEYQPNDDIITTEDKSEELSLASILIERKSKSDIKISCSKLIQQIAVTRLAIIDVLEKRNEGEKYVPIFGSKVKDEAKMFYQFMGANVKSYGFQMFVPAGRSFFSNIQSSIFSILATGNSIDPFLLEFGSYYERFKYFENVSKPDTPEKHIHNSLAQILNAKFVSDKKGDYLIHEDGRKINLVFCSSGQQEVLPLALILKNQIAVINSLGWGGGTFYIEEPEAHLFPSAQKKIVETIATVHNLAKGKSQLVITTHSPYILTSFNNLLQAGQLLESGANKKKLFKIVPEFEILKPGELNAYAFADGGVTSLIDEETGLISADLLDQVSEEIAVEFDELLSL